MEKESKPPKSRPRKDEFDYTVVYEENKLGFDFHSSSNKKKSVNAIVGKRTSTFATENIYKGSLMLSINGQWVVGLPSTAIGDMCKEALSSPPATIVFRGKEWMKVTKQERGTLKILVIKAKKLYMPGTHCSIRVSDALLTTDVVQRSTEP